MSKFYSNGKLLVSGEYLVLDGAVSLALPTKFGQSLEIVKSVDSNTMHWKSYNVDQKCWFLAEFDMENFKIIHHNNIKVATTLQQILITAKSLNPTFLKNNTQGLIIQTNLTFPNEWGLGTSSTLINNIAQWANVNAFELLEKSFGGSGYDIACAQNNTPITYKRNGVTPNVNVVNFRPKFKEYIFFVYLNQKQDSKEGIKMYRSLKVGKTTLIKKVNQITYKIIEAKTLKEFELLIKEHEDLLASLLNIQPVKQQLFSNFNGVVKSLGAWGGDFVMVTGTKNQVEQYFAGIGYTTVLSYDSMILN